MAVVGEKEVSKESLAVRSRGAGDLGDVSVEELMAKMLEADAAAKELHDVMEPKPKSSPMAPDAEADSQE